MQSSGHVRDKPITAAFVEATLAEGAARLLLLLKPIIHAGV